MNPTKEQTDRAKEIISEFTKKFDGEDSVSVWLAVEALIPPLARSALLDQEEAILRLGRCFVHDMEILAERRRVGGTR